MILAFIHKATALFLTFILLANGLNNVVIISDFVINQDFIAKTLCIQKDNQQGCHGKCQLTKELTINNIDSTSEAPKPLIETIRLDVFILWDFISEELKICSNIYKPQLQIAYRIDYTQGLFYAVETPPPN